MAITASNAQSSKISINLRLDDRSRQLIDDAAQSLGKTRTDFMVETARSLAIDVLLDRRLIALEDDQHAAFVTAPRQSSGARSKAEIAPAPQACLGPVSALH